MDFVHAHVRVFPAADGQPPALRDRAEFHLKGDGAAANSRQRGDLNARRKRVRDRRVVAARDDCRADFNFSDHQILL